MNKDQSNNSGVLNDLDWELQPERDLWPTIESHVRFRKIKPGSNRWMSVAVAACLMLAVGAFVMATFSYQQSQHTQQLQAQYVEYQKSQIALMEQHHELVRAQFVALLNSDVMTTKTRNELQQVLVVFDQAGAQLKEAMLSQPTNSEYATQLAHTYEQELELLNTIKTDYAQSVEI